MQALADSAGSGHEVRHVVVGHDDVGGCDGFLLVETPDVQLVDGLDSGDLLIMV